MKETKCRYPKEEFARRGDIIYEQSIRPGLEPADKGKYVAIDIKSGAFELDADEMAACHRLRDRYPAAQIWLKRVGFQHLRRFGGYTRKPAP